jgi:hypothetical protein
MMELARSNLPSSKGIRHMNPLDDAQPAFESELIDLDGVSLTVLRRMPTAALGPALPHIVEETEDPTRTKTSCSNTAGAD